MNRILLLLTLSPGSRVKLGDAEFTVAGVVRMEPDRMTGSLNVGPRAMITRAGLDRTGLLYELTATLSKLNLNIASAHVATFGERVVDVFYVTDLMGAQITSPTRQAAIKRALIALFKAAEANGKQTKGAASEARPK